MEVAAIFVSENQADSPVPVLQVRQYSNDIDSDV